MCIRDSVNADCLQIAVGRNTQLPGKRPEQVGFAKAGHREQGIQRNVFRIMMLHVGAEFLNLLVRLRWFRTFKGRRIFLQNLFQQAEKRLFLLQLGGCLLYTSIPAIAMRKPKKKRPPGLLSLRNSQAKIAVKKGAMEIMTPTLEARV